MDIRINAEVRCTDGLAGFVSRAILNPITDELTHIVIKHHEEEYEIDADHILSATEEMVKLDCTRQYLYAQPHFMEVEYVRAPLEHRELEAAGTYPTGYYYKPYVTMETYTVTHEHIPEGELAFTRGTQVFAKEGHIGQIDELVVNPDTHHITHIVLRKGHLWGKKDVVIGIEHIKNLDEDGVHLKMTKAQIEALPTVPLKRRFGQKVPI